MGQAFSPLGIVGAGAMGAGIARVAAEAGLDVLLYDKSGPALTAAFEAMTAKLARDVEKGRLDVTAAGGIGARIRPAVALSDFAPCAVVIEAIVEDLEAKRELFRALEDAAAVDAILASNTSSLSIAAIAAACARPERVAGLHFFNPVPMMRLVEVVAAPLTEPAVLDRLVALGEALGKVPVRVKDAPGFLVNLGGRAYTTEALHVLAENVAAPDAIDAIMRDCCHFRMGPFELMDLTGIDVNYPATRAIHEGYGHDARLRTTPHHRTMLLSGRLGRKTGAGFYVYAGEEGGLKAPVKAQAGPLPQAVVLPRSDRELVDMLEAAGVKAVSDDEAAPILVALEGEDCSTYAARTGTDERRLVGIDLMFDTSKRVTLMTGPGAGGEALGAVVATMAAAGRESTPIRDSAGFVAQRIVAMMINLGAEMAQIGIAAPADIDKGMTLGLNYPRGPLAWGDEIGPGRVHALMTAMQEATGSDRYRPSLWLRRRALLGLGLTVE